MDLSYLRDHPQNVALLIEHQRIRSTPLTPSSSVCTVERLTLDDGTDLFAKTWPGAPDDFFSSEATELRWLGAAGAAPVPDVIAATRELLLLEWIEPGEATAAAAEDFGRGLSALHRAGAETFGVPWDGYISYLPLDNTPAENWPEFYVERRCRPYLRQATDAGTFDAAGVALVEKALDRVADVAGPPELPARIHGDLWSGNVHYGRDGRAWLVDPAAHGGHRETDLGMLALFGAPHLDRVLASYHEAYPLADGWRDRVPLHQLHPLLVHTVLFGRAYLARALDAARAVGRL